MKKLVILAVLLLCFSLAYGLLGTISAFDSQGEEVNITFTSNENQTFYIDIPRYAIVTNITLTLEGDTK